MDVSSYTKAIGNAFYLAVKDWPLWFGFAATGYAGDMVEQQFRGQNVPLQYLAHGIAQTIDYSLYYTVKHPAQANSDLAKTG